MNLNALVVLDLLAVLLLDVHVFIAEAVQETIEAVSSGLLTEAGETVARVFQFCLQNCPNILQKLFIGL